MKSCLIVVGASSHVLDSFMPTKQYECLLISKRSSQNKSSSTISESTPTSYFNYDLTDSKIDLDGLCEKIEPYSEIDIIYSAYSAIGLNATDSIEKIKLGLLANCAQPIYFLSNLSQRLRNKTLNAVFISSMYARLSPDPRKYIADSQINPLYYGVAKAGVEQGLRWLSASNSCLLYTSPSPRDRTRSRMPSSA